MLCRSSGGADGTSRRQMEEGKGREGGVSKPVMALALGKKTIAR